MKVTIRKFEKADIPNKVNWINDPENNTYLHYELPLEITKTEVWFEKNKDRVDRYDAVIEVDGNSVGLLGLLSIDNKNRKAEYYIMLGNRDYLRKGVAAQASRLLLEYAFQQLGLNRIYLYTEKKNVTAIKSYERIGFQREGLLKQDLFHKGHYVDRYVYSITKHDFYGCQDTPIYKVGSIGNNTLFIKREDLLPFSFGGNKARKAKLFFEEIYRGSYDCVVTYGSSSSNHCRIVSNLAMARGMKCYIISPEEASKETYNSKLMDMFGAEIVVCSVDKVQKTIEDTLQELKKEGYSPYFIAGGGHGTIGTQAYVECYEEISKYEKEHQMQFDYIFHASGTGTTQAGLICGQLINGEERTIVGISIARKNPRGRQVVLESVKEYLLEHKVAVSEEAIEDTTILEDGYIQGGYGACSEEVIEVIKNMMQQYGLPLDTTYTGKAMAGMLAYMKQKKIENKKILFIHTGGTPLFFDYLKEEKN